MGSGDHSFASSPQSKPEKWCGSGGGGLGGCGEPDPRFPFSWPVTLKVGLLLGAIIGWRSGVRGGSAGFAFHLEIFPGCLRIRSGLCEEGSVPHTEGEPVPFFFLFFSRASLAKVQSWEDSWADSRQVGCDYEFKAIGAEADRVANHSCGPRNPFSHPPHACQA